MSSETAQLRQDQLKLKTEREFVEREKERLDALAKDVEQRSLEAKKLYQVGRERKGLRVSTLNTVISIMYFTNLLLRVHCKTYMYMYRIAGKFGESVFRTMTTNLKFVIF